MSVYLYALLADLPPGPLGCGIQGEPLRALECAGLVAIIGTVPETPAVDAGALRAHDQTVRRLAGMSDAILPVRFGSVVDDERDLARLLEPDAQGWRDALARVAGREQMTMRVYGRGEPAPVPRPEGESNLGPGARYLDARRRAAHREGLAALAALGPALAPLVSGERVERHGTPPLLASVHHLIRRGGAAAYAARAEEAAARLADVTVTVSGPWPPYAFAGEGPA